MALETVRLDQVDDPEDVRSRLKVAASTRQALPVTDHSLFTSRGPAPVVWAVGARGGAGATTLARVCVPFGDAKGVWPAEDKFPFCVVVCRSTRTGLDAAQSAVLQAENGNAGGCTVLGIVIVADVPGKIPKVLTQRERVLEDLTKVWCVPYLAGFCEHDPSDLTVWNPTDQSDDESSPRRGHRKKQHVTEAVPAVIAEVATQIFRAAYAAHQDLQQEESK